MVFPLPSGFVAAAPRRIEATAADGPAPGLAETPHVPLRGIAPLVVEMLDAEAMAGHAEAWADLARRALEPDVFADPAFCLPLALSLPPAARPRFLTVSAADPADRPRLVAVCPVAAGPVPGLLSVWQHELAALGLPMFDRDAAVPALEAMFARLGREAPGFTALEVRTVPAEGATFAALRESTWRTARPMHLIDPRRRALLGAEPAVPAGLPALSGRRRKEALRQRRRLADGTALRFVSDGSAEAFERFLRFEARGWKGAAGTALLGEPGRAAFARRMAARLAAEGRLQVHALMRGEEPVAMGVVLSAAGRDFFWKTSYAEDYAAHSPGLQLVLDLTARQRQERRATDSCAVPDHPMIDRLWTERLALVDVAVGIEPGRTAAFASVVLAERGRRAMRAAAKSLAGRLGYRRGGPQRR